MALVKQPDIISTHLVEDICVLLCKANDNTQSYTILEWSVLTSFKDILETYTNKDVSIVDCLELIEYCTENLTTIVLDNYATFKNKDDAAYCVQIINSYKL